MRTLTCDALEGRDEESGTRGTSSCLYHPQTRWLHMCLVCLFLKETWQQSSGHLQSTQEKEWQQVYGQLSKQEELLLLEHAEWRHSDHVHCSCDTYCCTSRVARKKKKKKHVQVREEGLVAWQAQMSKRIWAVCHQTPPTMCHQLMKVNNTSAQFPSQSISLLSTLGVGLTPQHRNSKRLHLCIKN